MEGRRGLMANPKEEDAGVVPSPVDPVAFCGEAVLDRKTRAHGRFNIPAARAPHVHTIHRLLLTFTNCCQQRFCSPASGFILSLTELSPIPHQAAPASTVRFLNAHIEFFPFLFSASSLDR